MTVAAMSGTETHHIVELDNIHPRRVVSNLPPTPGLVVLSGRWADNNLIITTDPTREITDHRELTRMLEGDDRQCFNLPADHDDDCDAVGGGWFGWLAYPNATTPPPAWFGLYPNIIRYDRNERRWYDEALPTLETATDLTARRTRLTQLVIAASRNPRYGRRYHMGTLTPSTSRDEYCSAVEQTILKIRAGVIYQANVCMQLAGPFTGNPVELYGDLLEAFDPNYAAIVCSPNHAVISASPELYLQRRRKTLRSEPIKGTRPRNNETPDDPGAAQLRQSAKERAENTMIVDLVRNDLARVADVGSVTVPKLLQVEPHCGVWHLVSAVEAELETSRTDADVFNATFPAGSITGAPKIAARDIINTVEKTPRGVYTGTVGFRAPGRVEFNVAIRTFELANGTIKLGVGAGITASSVPTLEWEECAHKAAPLMRAVGGAVITAPQPRTRSAPAGQGVFETILVLNGHPVDLDSHLTRLGASTDELWHRPLDATLRARALRAAGASDLTAGRLRVDVRPDGSDHISVRRTLGPVTFVAQNGLELRTVSHPGFGRHKWSDRSGIDEIEQSQHGDQALLIDAADAFLETTRGSILLMTRGGKLVTPPLNGQILPGTTRAALLDLAVDLKVPIEIRSVPLTEVPDIIGMAVCNALTGLQWVRRCNAHVWADPDPTLERLSDALLNEWRT